MAHGEAIPVTRELSLQAFESAELNVAEGGLNYATLCQLMEKVQKFEPSHRQSILVEVATRMLLGLLFTERTIYPKFEEATWLRFSRASNLEEEIEALCNGRESSNIALSQYDAFVRGMFERSGKTRQEFYAEMLEEAGIVMDFDAIEFGAPAMAFKRKALMSVHREHLLVFYLVELLIRANTTVNPKSFTLADQKVEALYKHFEAAIPLPAKFEKGTKDDTLFLYSARHWLLPAID